MQEKSQRQEKRMSGPKTPFAEQDVEVIVANQPEGGRGLPVWQKTSRALLTRLFQVRHAL
jgi:hypothetical protein